jgi:S-formylglutathione hydrolase FrmB
MKTRQNSTQRRKEAKRQRTETIFASLRLCAFALILFLPFFTPAQQPAKCRVETVQWQSKTQAKLLPYNAILPLDYGQNKTAAYPVLYLLHGLTGRYDNWTTFTKLTQYAAAYRLVIITPEGHNGWYTDSPVAPADKYESYLPNELIPDVERRFRVLKTREGRAIAGLSMGGYGALKFGVKHPDKFVFAGSMSGALRAAEWTDKTFERAPVFGETLMKAYGPADSPARAANDLFKLIEALTPEQIRGLPFLYADCGTEDFLFASNHELAKLLAIKKIPHEYRQSPGAHNWLYWDAQVQEILRLATARMSGPVEK